MGMMETIVFGMAALILGITAIAAVLFKKSALSVFLGIMTIGSMLCSLYYWRIALIDSGKVVTWLGFDIYPPVAVVTLAILSTGLICVILGLKQTIQHKKNN